MKVMLDEIARKRLEAEQARVEEQTRAAEAAEEQTPSASIERL